MIGKIARSGSDFLGALSYCRFDRSANGERKERGELIYRQMLDAFLIEENPELNTIAAELDRVASMNSRIRKPVCHVSLSFPPGEHPPREVLSSIVLDFAEDFGLWENGLLAYLHRDKQHEHVHIIANKIDVNGNNTFKSSFNYLSMGHFCRKMEHKYGLQKVKQMDALKMDGKENRKESLYHDHLRTLIDDLVSDSNSFSQLRIALLKKGYKSMVGNGITFVHAGSGVKIKGSDLGRRYSRQNLIKRLEGRYETDHEFNKQKLNITEKQRLRTLIRELAPKSSDFEDFVRHLNRKGYGVIAREKVNPRSAHPYTSLLFTKEFSEGKLKQNEFRPKILSGYQLGPEFRYSVIEGNFNRPNWEWTSVNPTLLENPKPLPTGNNESLELEKLFTSTNAAKVESEAGRARTGRTFRNNNPELEGRSEEEKKAEERKKRKGMYPRRR